MGISGDRGAYPDFRPPFFPTRVARDVVYYTEARGFGKVPFFYLLSQVLPFAATASVVSEREGEKLGGDEGNRVCVGMVAGRAVGERTPEDWKVGDDGAAGDETGGYFLAWRGQRVVGRGEGRGVGRDTEVDPEASLAEATGGDILRGRGARGRGAK